MVSFSENNKTLSYNLYTKFVKKNDLNIIIN